MNEDEPDDWVDIAAAHALAVRVDDRAEIVVVAAVAGSAVRVDG
jgi:hypothetical protein